VDPVILNNEMVQFLNVVKNLGLLIDRRLSCTNQLSHVVSRTYPTLAAAFSAFFISRLAHLPCSYFDLTDFFVCGCYLFFVIV
jgi:hypothetical protein